MNAKELQAAVREFRREIGPKSDVSMFLSEYSEDAVSASIHPFGMLSSKGYIRVTADDWAAALAKLKAEWAKYSDEHRRQTVKSMALAIIRLTTEIGECTDAALRAEFDAGAVASLGDEACTLADEMAGKGPFRIKRKRGANAA
jgi:hypothetical protein